MKVTKLKNTVLATILTTILIPVSVEAKHFTENTAFLINNLPAGKVKSKLKALSRYKKRKAIKWLHSFSFGKHDLKHMKVDNRGDVLFVDSFDIAEAPSVENSTEQSQQQFSAENTLKLHSKPDSSNVIYINVTGHTISGTAWNSSIKNIQTRAFDTDGDVTAFSNAELSQITEIWHRIAEDYAPFDVDVTTEKPDHFGPTTGHILITHSKDVSGNDMPYSEAGGAAYTKVWGRSDYASFYSPTLVYYNNLASFPPYISAAASHEMGHNLGLAHDGSSNQTYYRGHGNGFVSWGAIMGVGYYSNVTQWSKGEYADASMTQDDISLIGKHLTFRADDHGNDINTPTELLVDAQGNIEVTTPETDPHNLSQENKGIIETRNDVDYFVFDAGDGPLNIIVTPAWDSFYRNFLRGANLDIQASLYNWDGQLIASHDPLDETDAQIATTVSSGQYLLAVTGVGNQLSPYSDYGSLGHYFISGKVNPFSLTVDNLPPSPNPMHWTVAPYGQSSSKISMQASAVTDASGLVEYNFICVSDNNCNDSGWQTSKQYTATNLQAGKLYSFQVIARDAHANETDPSPTASASTLANQNPVASATATISSTSPLTVNFSSAGSYDPDKTDTLTFWWNFGDGTRSRVANPTHSYATANTYKASLTIRDNHASNYKPLTVTVGNSINQPPQRIEDLTAKITRDTETGGMVKLNWTAPSLATKYSILSCQVDTGTNRCTKSSFVTTTSDTSFITQLTNRRTYYWIYAKNSYGSSSYSNVVTTRP